MRPRIWLGLGLAAGLATTTLAHQGVTNPAVMARMEAMSAIGDATKLLGAMAKGETPFDAATARAAAEAIATHAGETPELFEAPEDDPKSEALPAIWADFADFTAKAQTLETAAKTAAGVASLDQLQTALTEIGATCRSCHRLYRK